MKRRLSSVLAVASIAASTSVSAQIGCGGSPEGRTKGNNYGAADVGSFDLMIGNIARKDIDAIRRQIFIEGTVVMLPMRDTVCIVESPGGVDRKRVRIPGRDGLWWVHNDSFYGSIR